MRKKEQILALCILAYGVSGAMCFTALLAKDAMILTPFAIILLVGTWGIRFLSPNDSVIITKKNGKTIVNATKTNPTENFGALITKYWNRFIAWLNS